jgi:ferredoxin
VAGSFTETVLKIAKTNKIPIDFTCENGECGTCVIKVTQLGDKAPMGYHLEEKEKTVLLELGKVTKDELEDMIVNDLPIDWSAYKDAGMGDAYADIPKTGGDFAKAIAACINSRQCEADGKQGVSPAKAANANAKPTSICP